MLEMTIDIGFLYSWHLAKASYFLRLNIQKNSIPSYG